MIKFIFYMPGFADAGDVELIRASENEYPAVLRFKDWEGPEKFLALAANLPSPGD
jgi:hypothetical protein